MKFKYLLIAFIIIIVFFILIIAVIPAMLTSMSSPAGVPANTEADFALSIRYTVVPLLIVMGLLLAGITIFFLTNYRLLSLLEREDWPALSYYLEQIIYVKGRYSTRKVKLLASSYLVTTDYASVLKLESKAMLAKPLVVERNALIFGAARVLSGDSKGAAAFFHTYMNKGNRQERLWMHWFYGFSQLLASEFYSAEREFKLMAASSGDALITGLSAYFLQSSVLKYSLNPDECKAAAEKGRSRVVNTFKTIEAWKKEADKTGTDIHIAIIRKYIEQAGQWIYSVNSEQ